MIFLTNTTKLLKKMRANRYLSPNQLTSMICDPALEALQKSNGMLEKQKTLWQNVQIVFFSTEQFTVIYQYQQLPSRVGKRLLSGSVLPTISDSVYPSHIVAIEL